MLQKPNVTHEVLQCSSRLPSSSHTERQQAELHPDLGEVKAKPGLETPEFLKRILVGSHAAVNRTPCRCQGMRGRIALQD